MSNTIAIGNIVNGRGDRKIRILSHPRRIAGGEVVAVTWASADDAPASAYFECGRLHPAHEPGFRWEEPVLNLG